ncbi:hypothetical protein K6959_05900 [Bacillus aquiflavi]|nr:hypothetical protein [Bacillus aquiflavi]UAC49380.1 hypothetical protein K6959_05900 [Bacillus aquiflavi]
MENGKIGQQVSAMQKKIDEALQADERMASLSAVQKELVAQAENLKQEMVANGLNPTTTNLSSSSQRYGKNQENDSKDSGANEHIGTEKESESGNETSSNAKKENESGNETDSLKAEKESSNSNKEGISSQIENSNEKGSELDANSQHLLTFPERITGDHHIKEDFGSFEKGQEQQAENDELVLKGSIRPYEEVYGQYEEAYRESINRMKLPHDLEDIVKAYFLNVDPNKE